MNYNSLISMFMQLKDINLLDDLNECIIKLNEDDNYEDYFKREREEEEREEDERRERERAEEEQREQEREDEDFEEFLHMLDDALDR